MPRALITHAHADHARPGCGEYWAVADSEGVLRQRLGQEITLHPVSYGETIWLNQCRVSFHSAGHVLGSPGDCPVNPVAGTCTDDRHGTCTIDGTCGCNAGYGGEDCRSPLMCPGEFCGDTNVIGVAPFGSDAMGTGAVTDGTVVPKPYLTLSHALSVSGDNATILMYPGTYPDDCGLTHTRSGTRIVGVSHVLPYTLRAIVNCANSPGTSFMTITDGNLLVRSLFASAAFTQ